MRRHHANWLHRHAAEDSPGTRLPFVANVLPVTVVGRTWSAATDTKAIIAVDDEGAMLRDVTSSDGYERLRPELERYLHLTPSKWQETSLSDLWQWIEVSRREVCYCNSDPQHRADCRRCDGWGFVAAEQPRRGRVGGATVDVETLFSALPPELLNLGGEYCHIGSAPASRSGEGSQRVVFARGDCWRALLMELFVDQPAADTPLYLPGVGPLWHARHDPLGRLVLADWYEERGEAEHAAHLREHVPPW